MHRNVQKNRRPRAKLCSKRRSTKPLRLRRRCARGVARYADRERIPEGRNRTIDRSNLNGLRAGADAQGTSAGEEDLEVDVTARGGVPGCCNDYD
jgi:hypothetical protein